MSDCVKLSLRISDCGDGCEGLCLCVFSTILLLLLLLATTTSTTSTTTTTAAAAFLFFLFLVCACGFLLACEDLGERSYESFPASVSSSSTFCCCCCFVSLFFVLAVM